MAEFIRRSADRPDDPSQAGAPGSVIERGIKNPLSEYAPVLAISLVRECDNGKGEEILIGRRTASNITHEDVISVPTVRVLPELARIWARPLRTGSLAPGALDRMGSVRRTVWHTVRALLTLKLGVADPLERGDLAFTVEDLTAWQGTSLIGRRDGEDVVEKLTMFNARVVWRGPRHLAPAKTAPYDPIMWTPVDRFLALARTRDVSVLERDDLDELQVCTRGLCIASTEGTISHLTSNVFEDLRQAVERWLDAGLPAAVPSARVASPPDGDRRSVLRKVTSQAVSLVTRAAARSSAGTVAAPMCEPDGSRRNSADFVVVAKAPHLRSPEGVTAVVARLLAFGVSVRGVQRLGATADSVVSALYPSASRLFRERPDKGSAVWQALEQRFGGRRFEIVFGQRYSSDLVMSGAEVIEEYGLDEHDLTSVWEEGRRPISRERMASLYGEAAAAAVMGDAAEHDWFRGDWPFGIQRIRSGIVAFALRHERIAGGAPLVVLNGYVPGLEAMFSADTFAIEAGIEPAGPQIADVRRWVIGHDNRPERSQPGTVRRDALDGRFPADADAPVTSRSNVVHCSNGLLAGALEHAALFRQEAGGLLIDRLTAAGLTRAEIDRIVLADPVVDSGPEERRLTDETTALTVDSCVDAITRLVPPVFGEANGRGSGVDLGTFERHLRSLEHHRYDPEGFSRLTEQRRALPARSVDLVAGLGDRDEVRGRRAIRDGQVGLVAPAGGTGGRFGGYGVPESDVRRQKALARVLEVADRKVCSLDIRLANAIWWRRELGAPLPLAVMAGPTNASAIVDWRTGQNRTFGTHTCDVYHQHGTYRLNADSLVTSHIGDLGRWVDHVLRGPDGTPLLKPPGNLGVLCSMAISGLYQQWRTAGVEILVLANGDDAGFRLDPRVVGHLLEHDLDAIVLGVPPDGRPDGGTFRGGGVICEVERDARWHVTVVEKVAAPSEPMTDALFSTNQLYLRRSALDPLLEPGGPAGPLPVVGSSPMYAERKTVDTGDARLGALQLFQTVGDVLRQLARVKAMAIDRRPSPAQPGGYAPLKQRSDIATAQAMLDQLDGDDQLCTSPSALRAFDMAKVPLHT